MTDGSRLDSINYLRVEWALCLGTKMRSNSTPVMFETVTPHEPKAIVFENCYGVGSRRNSSYEFS